LLYYYIIDEPQFEYREAFRIFPSFDICPERATIFFIDLRPLSHPNTVLCVGELSAGDGLDRALDSGRPEEPSHKRKPDGAGEGPGMPVRYPVRRDW
jgi:hypothetical protein